VLGKACQQRRQAVVGIGRRDTHFHATGQIPS
jgi:hypothetical protein